MSAVETVELHTRARADYKRYAVHNVEDRAIAGEIDGLKPVTRRLLWGTHVMGLNSRGRFLKAAKPVAETMGDYHPHGDVAIYGALVTAVNMPQPLFEGSGNWGSMTDEAAAMRYTECRLSRYADAVFFDRFYLNAIDYVPNYDDRLKEPLVLPALLPNGLLNGNFGIAPGVRTLTPTFTLRSLVATLVGALKRGEATPGLCARLVFTTELGGVMRQTPDLKTELLEFYTNGRGRFVFDSQYTYDAKHNAIRIDRFAPIQGIDNLLERVTKIAGVTRVRDDSSTEDRYNAYLVEFGRTTKGAALKTAIAKVMEQFSAAVTFNVQAVERRLDPANPAGYKELHPCTVPELLNVWIDYRVALEKTACRFWSAKHQEQIDYLNLMRLAVKNREFIIRALDKPLDDAGLAAYIAKGLKITVDQANRILDLKIRQLKKLEDRVLVDQIAKLKGQIRELKDRIARPKRFIAGQLVRLLEELEPRAKKSAK